MLPGYLSSALVLILLVSAPWSPVPGQAQSRPPYWTKAASPTVARQELYPEVLNGKIYVVGGLLSPNTGFSAHFESYDPANDAWTLLRPLPEARHHIALSAVKGLLYGVGGFTGGFPDWRAQAAMFMRGVGTPHGLVPVDESDRHRVCLLWLADAWHLPIPASLSLPSRRQMAAKGESGRADDANPLKHCLSATSQVEDILSCAERSQEQGTVNCPHVSGAPRNKLRGLVPVVLTYNPASNTWTEGADLQVARAEGISAVVDHKMYLIGGRVRATENARLFNDHIDSVRNEVFDPATGRWSARADAPTPRNSAGSAVIDGKIYVVGGRQFLKNADGTTRQVNVPTLEVYDPKLDRWQTRSPMPGARGGLAATALNGKLYVFGGEQWVPEQKVFAESWVYDPKTDVWAALPPLPTPRHGLGASAVGDRIFVFGGGTRTGGNAATAIHEVLVLPTDNIPDKIG